ncbi:glycoside hydrolase domain-containing protein [Ligilactobacillus murinus]|uniref:glycoside hydrolase domain-containing protein n=1 Tax=Ligilactobacillus murinus TaxID=1622 RepID=UPI00129838CB|nr:glycoside hydrolase domain-containing protein [Ligilactobacillus murinus]
MVLFFFFFIYFAIDVDVQEGEIGSGIVPYITSLLKTLKYTEYEVGIYGTRNVCLHGEKLGVKKSFVADMSYGWSGNLGFKMPKNWAFDQFSEYPIGGTPIDQDASSGRDKGVVITDFPKGISRNEVLKKISKIVSAFGVEFGKKITISVGVLDVTLEAKAAVEPKDGAIFAIKNGKFDSASIDTWLKKTFGFSSEQVDLFIQKCGEITFVTKIDVGNVIFFFFYGKFDSASIDTWLKKTFGFSSEQVDLFIQKCGEITFVTKIDVGNVIFENSIDPDGKLVASMTINIQKYEGQYLDESLALVFGLKFQLPNFPHLDLSSEVSVELPEVSKETLKNGILATTLLVVVIVLICSGVEEVALIAEVLSKLFTPLRYAV